MEKISVVTHDVPKELPDVRVIWGRGLLQLKKEGNILLHSVCIELGKFELIGTNFKIFVPNVITLETLKKPQNYSNLVETFSKLGYNLNVEIVLDESIKTQESKAQILERILGFDIKTI